MVLFLWPFLTLNQFRAHKPCRHNCHPRQQQESLRDSKVKLSNQKASEASEEASSIEEDELEEWPRVSRPLFAIFLRSTEQLGEWQAKEPRTKKRRRIWRRREKSRIRKLRVSCTYPFTREFCEIVRAEKIGREAKIRIISGLKIFWLQRNFVWVRGLFFGWSKELTYAEIEKSLISVATLRSEREWAERKGRHFLEWQNFRNFCLISRFSTRDKNRHARSWKREWINFRTRSINNNCTEKIKTCGIRSLKSLREIRNRILIGNVRKEASRAETRLLRILFLIMRN